MLASSQFGTNPAQGGRLGIETVHPALGTLEMNERNDNDRHGLRQADARVALGSNLMRAFALPGSGSFPSLLGALDGNVRSSGDWKNRSK